MNSLINDISTSFLDILITNLSTRLSTQLHIDKELLIKAIKDETFVLSIKDKNEEDKNEEDKNEEEKKEEDDDNEITHHLIFDFKDKTYRSDEVFWNHKGIKIDKIRYRLHRATNLILDPRGEDNQLYVIGLMNKDGELIDKNELPKVVKEWCKVHSLLFED
jgi:hypothetical protein